MPPVEERVAALEQTFKHLATQADVARLETALVDRVSAVEAELITSRWWMLAGIAFLSLVIGAASLFQTRNRHHMAATIAAAVVTAIHEDDPTPEKLEAERRSAAARKAWVTRRANERAAAERA